MLWQVFPVFVILGEVEISDSAPCFANSPDIFSDSSLLARWREGSSGRCATIGLYLLLFISGCAGPISELWPPPDGAPSVTVIVSLDTWHAMMALPVASKMAGDKKVYEEWGYAERAWYLEGRQGITGAIRALFWPTKGVVEVAVSEQIWAERTPQPPAEVFAFELSNAGYRRLRGYLQSTIVSDRPVTIRGPSRFYPARNSYHLFYHCHQYAAQALREAGLPISAWAAFSRSTFSMQLRQITAKPAHAQEVTFSDHPFQVDP